MTHAIVRCVASLGGFFGPLLHCVTALWADQIFAVDGRTLALSAVAVTCLAVQMYATLDVAATGGELLLLDSVRPTRQAVSDAAAQ